MKNFQKKTVLNLAIAALCFLVLPSISKGLEPIGPVVRLPAPGTLRSLIAGNNGDVKLLWASFEQPIVRSITSFDGGITWGESKVEFWTASGNEIWSVVSLKDMHGKVHVFPLITRGVNTGKIAEEYFLDIWNLTLSESGQSSYKSNMIFKGYVGGLINAVQLPNGRIVLPFASWVAGRKAGPPTGENVITALVSDNEGLSWIKSSAALTAPVPADPTTSQNGAIEPASVVLKNGKIWSLVRTQTGYLYETSSADGLTWSKLTPSKFSSSDSPASFLRLKSGELVLVWNNCAISELYNGSGVYSGRDALHAAISKDDGKSWYGFRQIYLDPLQSILTTEGDRGTAYPSLAEGRKGDVIVATGQGLGRGAILTFNTKWLYEKKVEHVFQSDGINGWATFVEYGPASNWSRKRADGAKLVITSGKHSSVALRVGPRAKDRPPEGANWNFPAAKIGRITANIMVVGDAGGAGVSLHDVFYSPTAVAAVKNSLAVIKFDSRKSDGSTIHLHSGQWNKVEIYWNVDSKSVVAKVNGVDALKFRINKTSTFGPSNIIFHGAELHGNIFVKSVTMEVLN